ncbi:MAG: ornithine acetyltransferase, partial [Fuerstiella sp.]|nr:ornithine acetyltransferase [Fuerstiella sp.]
MNSPLLPAGFTASGTTCGIKESGNPDLALFVSESAAAAAGVFATNRVLGAPVIVSGERVRSETARAVIINSGNANACTGQQGLDDARQMTTDVAAGLDCNAED